MLIYDKIYAKDANLKIVIWCMIMKIRLNTMTI